MEHGGELSAEEKYQTRNVAPRQHCDHCSHRSVNLIVVKVVQARSEDVLRNFPQHSREKRAGQRISQRYICLRHEAIDQNEEHDGNEITYRCEQYLPESATG